MKKNNHTEIARLIKEHIYKETGVRMIYYILPVSDKTELLCFDCFGLNNDNSYSFMFTDIEKFIDNKELMKFSEQIKNTVVW